MGLVVKTLLGFAEVEQAFLLELEGIAREVGQLDEEFPPADAEVA